jgi:predicted transcriptional regulator
MDCSIIRQGLCNKIEGIYKDFGQYLYRYACSNAQILINKFQNAFQVCFENMKSLSEVFSYSLIDIRSTTFNN